MRIALAGAAVVLLQPALLAQLDPSAGAGSQGIGQPTGQAGPASAGSGQATQPGGARESLGAPGETGQQMVDKQFLRSAVEDGLADVKLGSLAVEKGGAEVKTVGQQMVDDHTSLNKGLGDVADSMGVMLPRKMSKDDQAEYEKLMGLSGKDFDTEYLTYTLKMHRQNLHSFYMEGSATTDTGLQAEIGKAMMAMHQHLTIIAKAATAEGITLPPRPPRPAATTATK
jgi:putative membrane protein